MMKFTKSKCLPVLGLALGLTLLTVTGCGKKADPVVQAEKKEEAKGVLAPGIAETKAIAEEAFIYGLPIVMNYAVMNEFVVDKNSGQYKGPFNIISNEARVFTYKDTAVVTPNSDTPYSMLWLDLRAEPMVISVPAVDKKRYYSVQLTDGNAYNYGYIGSRATGVDAGSYLVVGPDWKGETPAGIKKVFQSSTPFALSIFRTQLFDAGDMPNVVKVQAGYQAQPLSAFLKQPAPPAAPDVKFVPATTAGIKENFYAYLDAALQFVPVSEEDRAVRARLASIGIGPGKTFDFKDLSLEHKAAVLLAMKEGDDKVDKYLNDGMKDINGWKVGSLFGDRAFYKGDWLKRAAAAKGGIYGNDGVEAMYPMTRVDGAGATLDGSKHNYTLTFGKDQLPPVHAFWSVTMYDGKTQLLIENPINRYLINSPMLPGMKKNADGSLTIHIQKDSPGKDKEANWLPAPNDSIYLVMRLYWPKTQAPSILPPGEGSWNPPSVMVAK
ncbi:MAG: DUF1254 domain-containing protein [Burkholderiaceae bacterium]|nr:DUF1254 domain-containing protein [Burkholderiaceae bacterium]